MTIQTTPGYWMHESSGVLRPVIEDYVNGRDLTPEQIPVMRAYLRQWIFAPIWRGGEELAGLRDSIDSLTTQANIDLWIERAMDLGLDPL